MESRKSGCLFPALPLYWGPSKKRRSGPHDGAAKTRGTDLRRGHPPGPAGRGGEGGPEGLPPRPRPDAAGIGGQGGVADGLRRPGGLPGGRRPGGHEVRPQPGAAARPGHFGGGASGGGRRLLRRVGAGAGAGPGPGGGGFRAVPPLRRGVRPVRGVGPLPGGISGDQPPAPGLRRGYPGGQPGPQAAVQREGGPLRGGLRPGEGVFRGPLRRAGGPAGHDRLRPRRRGRLHPGGDAGGGGEV